MRAQVRAPLSPRAAAISMAAGVAVLAIVWCVASYGGWVKPLFLPTPSKVIEGALSFNDKGWLWPAVIRSTARVLESLLWVVVVGVPVGVLMGAFTRFDLFMKPLVNGMKAVPTSALIGLIVLWFGITERAILAFLMLGAVFYMIVLTAEAVRSVPQEYVDVAEDFDATPLEVTWRVLIPGALPGIWGGIIVCNAIMWTYIVLAEYINMNMANIGLGGLLKIGAGTMKPGQVFAAIIIIAVVANLTDLALKAVQRKWLPW